LSICKKNACPNLRLIPVLILVQKYFAIFVDKEMTMSMIIMMTLIITEKCGNCDALINYEARNASGYN